MPTINWKQAPRKARWWAVDQDGQAHWYCAPDVAPFTAFWFAASEPAPTFGFSGDWRESLTERPIEGKAR
ncbi:MAG: bacteriophage protein [Proteobacteria bacterium]|nr:bacteriophage protein [Pseudomonadota bacterium]